MTRRNRGRNNRRGTPYIAVVEDVSIATADTAANTTVANNADNKKRIFHLPRGPTVSVTNGSADSSVFFILRRVPSGYTVPSAVTISSGNASFTDVPNVLAWALYRYESGQTTALDVRMTVLRSVVNLFPGDLIVLQAVPNTSSAGLVATAQAEYRLM